MGDAAEQPGNSDLQGGAVAGASPTASQGEVKAIAAPLSGRFAPVELEAVLKRYDLGRIDSIREFTRGSAQAPKVVLAGPYGKFLLKRRAPGEDHPYQVAFCHGLQLHLADRGFPVPALVGTREDNNSMLQMDGRVYEVTEFIDGEAFDRSVESARAAGAMLARFHAGASGFHSTWHTPPDFAHGDERAEILLDRCLDRLAAGPGASGLIDALRGLWRRCVSALDHAGIAAWPRELVHGDWHPGNLVYAGRGVRAVLDYDSCRRGPRVFDLAGGALHFSIVSTISSGTDSSGEGRAAGPGSPDPGAWPAEPDAARASAFLAGYQLGQSPINAAEQAVLAPAMAAAMILEALPPVAATGGFAGIPGTPFLDMVRRKSAWLLDHADVVGGLAART